MANYTTNYNLKKPVQTKNYNVEDQNGNMDIIDTKIKETSNKIGDLSTLTTTDKTSVVNAVIENTTSLLKNTQDIATNTANIATINTKIADTGWIDLTLLNGATVQNGFTPRYRRIGKIVIIKGIVTTVSSADTVVATLPTGFRPSTTHYFVNTKNVNNTVVTMIGYSSGNITITGASNGSYLSTDYNCINSMFLID